MASLGSVAECQQKAMSGTKNPTQNSIILNHLNHVWDENTTRWANGCSTQRNAKI